MRYTAISGNGDVRTHDATVSEAITLANVWSADIFNVKMHILFRTNIPSLNPSWADDHTEYELRLHCHAALEVDVYGKDEALHRRRLRTGWYERNK